MSVRNLEPLFAPRAVALIGASRKPQSVGDVVARNLLTGGFDGPVMMVNPSAPAVHATLAYPDIASLPLAPDLAVVCTPPETVPQAIAELAARGTRAAVVITAGFGEMGPDGLKLQQRALDAARPHLLRIVGPNCVGILSPHAGLNASFAQRHAAKGGLAFISQSGAIVTSVLDWAAERGIGFSKIVSLGGAADVDFGDLLDYFAGDADSKAALVYVEAVSDARKFMSAARRCARLKPVVVVKGGRFEEGARAAASHTGALAGSDAVYDAAFRRAGMLRVMGIEELFDAVETLAMGLSADGDRLAMLTNGGGIGVMAADSLAELGGRLAELAPATLSALDAVLPRTWSRANPVDIIGDAPGARYAAALQALLRDPGVDAVLTLNCPVAIADSGQAALAVVETVRAAQKAGGRAVPVLASWLGSDHAVQTHALFANAGIPSYPTPEQAVRAFAHLTRHRRNQDLLLQAPQAFESVSPGAKEAARPLVAKALKEGRTLLTEPESKALLAAYGVPVVRTETAATPDAAAKVAAELGFPVAIKILSPDITHKSDAGGVALNLGSASAVRAAAEAMLEKIGRALPDARLDGFTVQPMAARPRAHELICGLTEDRVFGPVLLFGQGGTAVEVVKDQAVALLPVNALLARDLISRTRVFKLLQGYRDRPAADCEAVVRTLLALGQMAADIPELAELDVNPLWADQSGVLALDARVRLSPGARPGTERFAIRPYPDELERSVADRSGRAYALRPVRPEDAPLLQDMIARCDPEDIRMRFFAALRRLPGKLAARLTQIDYDREMSFVALDAGAACGVVRLSEDPNRERAEYAVMVRSDLKGTGLGYRLMQEIVAYARARGVAVVFGDVLRENVAMLAMAQELGFAQAPLPGDESIVEVTLDLRA